MSKDLIHVGEVASRAGRQQANLDFSIGDSAANAPATVTESATDVIEGAAPTIDAITGGVAGWGQTAASTVDSAETVPADVAGGTINAIAAR